MSISTLKLFMENIPEKPSVVHELGQWKGHMTLCIKKGIEKCKKFVKAHKLRKETKRTELTVTLLNDPKNVEVFNANIEEIKNMTIDNQLNNTTGEGTIDSQFQMAFGQQTLENSIEVREEV